MSHNNNKFITARPDTDHGIASTGSYTPGTSLHLRASPERQENLHAYADYLIDCDKLHVNLDSDAETASIQNYGDNDQPTIITIPTFEHENVDIKNPFPNLDDEEFYAMLQYAEVVHEGGHHEHTDQPSVNNNFEDLTKRLTDFPYPLQGFLGKLCKDLWNAIEDGAMEEAIRNERGPKVAQRLAIKNETFIAQSVKRYPEKATKNVTFDFALHIAAMDLAKYDTGALRRLFDEEDPSWQFDTERDKDLFMDLYPELRRTVEDAFTTPNPAARTNRIFTFLNDVIEAIENEIGEDIEDKDTADQERDELRRGQQDDTENQSGPAQTQQSEGLQQNSRQDVAQQHANVTQQTVTTESDEDSNDNNGEAGHSEQQSADSDTDSGSQSQSQSSGKTDQQSGDTESSEGHSEQQTGDTSQPGDEDTSNGDGTTTDESGDSQSEDGNNGDATTGSEEIGSGGSDADESETICPGCGSTDTGRLVQHVDGMIAARVNAPFDITGEWVGSITFVSNDEVCGFRVKNNGSVPRQKIEDNGYKVVDVSGGVEILEPRSHYGETEPVKGFECNSCGHAWVPTIGGDSA